MRNFYKKNLNYKFLYNNKLNFCIFCGKNQNEVYELITDSFECICNECVKSCNNVLYNKYNKNINIDILKKTIFTPLEIFNQLNKYIIGQNKAKKILSVAVYNHYKKLSINSLDINFELKKSNILLVGPTGSGKTLLAETLARIINVPFLITDATTLTEAGYVGEDVENIIYKLLFNAKFKVKDAENGIIYIDEIDKISRKYSNFSNARDVSGEGVQQALLKLIEGTISSIPLYGSRKSYQQEYVNVNTSKILFICGGSFSGIEEIILNRLKKKTSIGFNAFIENKKKIKKNILKYIKSSDLIKFGLIVELIGRLPIISTLNLLSSRKMSNILFKPKNSLINQYKILFSMDNVELQFTKNALISIAKKAIKSKLGARGLRSIIEKRLLDIMFIIPSIRNIKSVLINSSVINKNKDPVLILRD